MRTLSEVFAPGAPTLPEGLRTLVVSPDRELEPGMTVRATFAFRNQGGAVATGVRVRFTLPEGLVYLVGSGKLDGAGLDDELGNSPILSRGGADIGDVEPGEERQVELSYSVAGAIENGTTIELQAAVASFEVPPVGSNVVRLIARSRPQLQNALTLVTIETRQDPVPGAEAHISVRVHNAGESSAHDVVVVAPVPPNATYVAGSARVNGREIERDLGVAFDRLYAPVVARSLSASATATLVYRIRIDTPLADGTIVAAHAQVASQESPAFALTPASVVVRASPEFDDERTALLASPDRDARPGSRVALTLSACNAGTAAAEAVSAMLELPDALVPVRGASTIDERTIRERRKDPLHFDLGRIEAGATVTLRAEATIASPLADGTILPASATLSWEPARDAGARRLECSIAVRSDPALPARSNALQRLGSDVVKPGDEIEAVISMANDGSAAARDVIVHLRADPALGDVRVFDKTTRVPMDDDTIDLDTLEAYATRRLTVRANVRSPYPNRSEIHLEASLHTRELGETPLGEAVWMVDSHPAFDVETSRFDLTGDAVLRPNQLAGVDVVLVNTGTDVAHDVRLRLYVSPEARLESVDGAVREKSSLVFGDVQPGGQARARLALRLLRSLAREYPVTVDGVVTAAAMLPVPLPRLTIATTAQPDFSVGTLRSEPVDVVDVGETIEWRLYVRNGGDGPARRAEISIARPESLIYVPNSTTVNDVPVRDVGAAAPFAAERGIVLNDVDPGVEATICWHDVVNNGLVRRRSHRRQRPASLRRRTRRRPRFERVESARDAGVRQCDSRVAVRTRRNDRTGVRPRPARPGRRTVLATPTGYTGGRRQWHRHHAGRIDLSRRSSNAPGGDTAGALATGPLAPRTGVSVSFNARSLDRTLRFIDEAHFGGVVTHLFAMRAFLPDALGDAHGATLAALARFTAGRTRSSLHQTALTELRHLAARYRNAVVARYDRTAAARRRVGPRHARRTSRRVADADRNVRAERAGRFCRSSRKRRTRQCVAVGGASALAARFDARARALSCAGYGAARRARRGGVCGFHRCPAGPTRTGPRRRSRRRARRAARVAIVALGIALFAVILVLAVIGFVAARKLRAPAPARPATGPMRPVTSLPACRNLRAATWSSPSPRWMTDARRIFSSARSTIRRSR